jgi:ankyrin repeat protein
LETPNIDVDASDENGQSALHWAVCKNYLGIVRLLLTSGANPTLPNNYGYTPFSIAKGNSKILKLLRLQNHHNEMEDDTANSNTRKWPLHHLSDIERPSHLN